MAKGKDGGRKDPPNFNMMGNPDRKATTPAGISAEGKMKPKMEPKAKGRADEHMKYMTEKQKEVDNSKQQPNKGKDIDKDHDKDR